MLLNIVSFFASLNNDGCLPLFSMSARNFQGISVLMPAENPLTVCLCDNDCEFQQFIFGMIIKADSLFSLLYFDQTIHENCRILLSDACRSVE